MSIKRGWLWFLLAAALVSAFFHFRSPNIPDPDSLYHIRHAYILRTNGIFNTEFPWTYYSAVRTHAADLWYGFHLLLIPFTFSNNLLFNLKIAGVLFTALLLSSFYWVGMRHKFSLPAFWPFLFLLAIPNSLFQLLMVRPHALSLTLSILLLSFLIQGAALTIFLISFGITFFHLSFFWIGPAIAGLVLLIRLLQKNNWQKGFSDFAAVILGIAGGAILRPEPVSALKLVYIQVVKLLVEKQRALPLLFSRELAPLSFASLTKVAPIFLLLWLIAAAVFLWHIKPMQSYKLNANAAKDQKLFLWASGILSFGFLLMTLFIARRSLMFWPGFGALFLGGVYSFLPHKKFGKDMLSFVILIGFLIAAPLTIYQNAVSLAQNAAPPDYLRESAEWLKENSIEGDIVFNTHWDNFSQLFFWNQKNYYIGGMDPIFQYAYDPRLYWEFHFLSNDENDEFVCSDQYCSRGLPSEVLAKEGGRKGTYEALKNDFQVKYVLIEKRSNPTFYRWLELDPRFERKFDNGKEAVFLLK